MIERGGIMLEKVVFALRKDTTNRLRTSLDGLTKDIEGHHVKVAYTVCAEEERYTEQCSATGDEGGVCKTGAAVYGTDIVDRDTLYITDSSRQYDFWHEYGRYVLPYRHQGNRTEAFEGAEYLIEKLDEIDYGIVDMAYRRLAGIPWEILRTKRCIVRETIEEDVDSLYDIYEEPMVTEYMEKLYDDRNEEIAYIRDYRRRMYGFYGYGIWTILTKQEGKVIGRAGISWREEFDVPELGFVIGVPWQRQGYAYEVCSAILNYAWKDIGFKQIQALVMEHNEKSAALCQKLGFKNYGITMVEGVRYLLYKLRLKCDCGV